MTTRIEPTWFGRNWPLLALTAGAIAIAIVSRHAIYPALSWNRDEATYLWQVDALRGGHIFTTAGDMPNFFWPWLAGYERGFFFSQYTAGWPLALLAADVIFGSPDVALAAGTVLAVLGTYFFTRELTDDRRLALVSATLMLASPIVIIQSGVYLGYLFSLGLGLFFGATLLASLRGGTRWLALVSGALLGWILLTRPFDAVLWGIPLFGYAAVVSWRKWQPLRRAVLWSAIGFLPFLAFTFFYNHRISGSFTEFPITTKNSLDSFGFGLRQLMPIGKIYDYTVGHAFDGLTDNLLALPPFLVGSWLGAVAVLVGIWMRRRDRSTIALLGIAIAFPLGYFFFWGSLLSSRTATESGPVYYVPLYSVACIFLATVLIGAWRHRRSVAIVLGVALAATTIPYAASKIDSNHKISAAQEPWKHATDSIDRDALVIVENSGFYLMHLNPFSANTPYLDGRLLYSVDLGAGNIDVITAHPDRKPYLERTTDYRFDNPVFYHDAPIPRVSLIPLQVLRGTTMRLRARITNPGDGRAVVAYLQVGNHVERRTLATDAAPGDTFETEWRLAPRRSPEVTAGTATPLKERLGEIRIGVGSAASVDDALAGKQSIEQFSYRLDPAGGTIDVLHPSRKFTAQKTRRELRLEEVSRLRDLDVEVTPA